MAFAILDLKWSPDQFWRSTPCELFSVFQLADERNKDTR
jgi:hypothetical protein